VIVEGSLLGVAFSAKLLRNRAEKHGGQTRPEKKLMFKLAVLWYSLSAGVIFTQVFFIMATTNGKNIGGAQGLLVLALARAVAAVVADYYTAFVSEEQPNDGERAIEIQEEQTEFTSKMLEQKRMEVEIINAGAIKVQETAQTARVAQARTEQKAAMEMDRLETEQKLLKMENAAKIARLEAQQNADLMLIQLSTAAAQAQHASLMRMVNEANARNGTNTEPLKIVRIEEEG